MTSTKIAATAHGAQRKIGIQIQTVMPQEIRCALSIRRTDMQLRTAVKNMAAFKMKIEFIPNEGKVN
jgi:bifunctional DNA-binding transcriptional regulator/antitoxin component of YhaV-PrlF toxin-antitoxin module